MIAVVEGKWLSGGVAVRWRWGAACMCKGLDTSREVRRRRRHANGTHLPHALERYAYSIRNPRLPSCTLAGLERTPATELRPQRKQRGVCVLWLGVLVFGLVVF